MEDAQPTIPTSKLEAHFIGDPDETEVEEKNGLFDQHLLLSGLSAGYCKKHPRPFLMVWNRLMDACHNEKIDWKQEIGNEHMKYERWIIKSIGLTFNIKGSQLFFKPFLQASTSGVLPLPVT